MYSRSDLTRVRRVVVKLGTRVCIDDKGRLNGKVLCALVEQIVTLRARGVEVIVVSSGAVGMGRERLRVGSTAEHLPTKQALAAVGQVEVMAAYRNIFGLFHVEVAQVLLTREEVINKTRFLNVRNTLLTLLQFGIVPVINENDSVSTAEIRFGDNDNLAALVGALASADVVINLTSAPGVLRKSAEHPEQDEVVDIIEEITPEIEALDRGDKTSGGTGGLASKLQAAKLATRSGAAMLIAPATEHDILLHLLAGEQYGTLFVPTSAPLSLRKRWLAGGSRPTGTVVVDSGAAVALASGGNSLLPVGVLNVQGEFEAGELVTIVGEDGREIARGICNYDATETNKIKGLPSSKIEQVLGHSGYHELVHYDNLVLQ